MSTRFVSSPATTMSGGTASGTFIRPATTATNAAAPTAKTSSTRRREPMRKVTRSFWRSSELSSSTACMGGESYDVRAIARSRGVAGKVAALGGDRAPPSRVVHIGRPVNNYDPPKAQVTGEPARVRTRRTLSERAADALLAARSETGAVWWASTRTGADVTPECLADREADDGATQQTVPQGLVAAFAAALRGARRWEDEVMRAGWGFGVLAHSRRVPMHFVVEDLDLLAGMLI